MAKSAQDHYASDGIVERILAALDRSEGGEGTLATERLYPHDQLHGREIMAPRDYAGTTWQHPTRRNPESLHVASQGAKGKAFRAKLAWDSRTF